MGIGSIARFAIGKVLIGFFASLLVFYGLPQYPLTFQEFWLLITGVGIAVGILLWLLIPDFGSNRRSPEQRRAAADATAPRP